MKISKALIILLFSTIATAQHLTIDTSGQTGTSGTNWSITDNILNIAASGSATIHPNVITNHLTNTGDLTVNLPWQSGVTRNTLINNSIIYTGASGRSLIINSPNNIVFANATGITSSTASLNVVLRTVTGASASSALIKMDGININTNGGHFWAGGGTTSTTWNGLTVGDSAAVTVDDDNAGISIIGSTIATNGGNIRAFALSNNGIFGDADGVNYGINVENSTVSSGTGSIYFNADLYGRYSNGTGMRVSGATLTPTSITSTTGAIYIRGYGTDATTNLNLWRHAAVIRGSVQIKSVSGAITIVGDAAFAGTVNDKEGLFITDGAAICSMTGNINLRGTNTLETSGQYSNSIRFDASNVANSIRIGYDGTSAYSGNITIEGNSIYQRSTQSGAGSIAVQTTGTLTIQPTGTAFTYMRAGNDGAGGSLTFDDDWNFGTNLGGFVYGKTTNTTALTYSNALTTSGPITMYAGTLVQNGAVSSGGAITFNCSDFTLGIGTNISTSSASDITFNSNGNFTTTDGTRRTISSANGNIIINADMDANGSGTLSIDYLTFNPGTGATIIRGETVSFYPGSVTGPYINGTGSFTFQSSDASFGPGIYTSWFEIDQDNNGIGGLTLGKVGNLTDIQQNTSLTVAGPVNMYGGNIVSTASLTATNSDLSLYASTAVTQTSPIIAAGLSLNGTGTFTLTNTSNNFTTLAGGAIGSLLGTTQVIDASGGLTIGTVGTTSGLTGSSTIRVETLAGNLTLSGSIITPSTSTDAVILTAGKSSAIGVPTGGDILVSGSPTINMGAGAIAKLFSGYDVTSTGLTDLVGASNVRYNYDETTTTYNPVLSASNKYAIYRTALGYGDLNIVSSGGDAEGTTWSYANGVIKTTSGTANVLNTVVQTKLNEANLSIEANKVTFSANVTGTTSNSLSILSKTHIVNTNATTITIQGGNVLFASNVDDATDGESTTNGYIQLRQGITVNSNGGNITFGGGNTSGSDYSFGSSDIAYTEGIRFDAVIALNSGGGNISIRGKSYAMGVPFGNGAAGVGFYFFNSALGTINSGTGTITIDGFSQTNTSTYASGIYSMHNINITSANTTTDAIRLIGKATGASGEAWGIETESIFTVLATGTGGGITVSSSQQNSGNNYDIVFRGETNILAKSGPINLLGGQSGGIANGTLLFGNNAYLGSKASSAILTSSSNITIQYDLHNFSGYNPKLATSGTLNWRPASASFGQTVQTAWFSWNQNSQTMSGLTIGKSGNTPQISFDGSNITVGGPVNLYGNIIGFSAALTASGDLSLYANTAVTQTAPIIAAGLSLNGTGTFTLNNTSNNFTTLAGGAVGSLIGATQIVDVSGGLTIGTIGSNTGLTGSNTIRVETLAGNLTLAGSISTTSTSTDAVILTAAKNTAIGVGSGGDIIVSGTPNITMGSGGIGKLFSGLESTSSGLTTLAGGSSNVRYNYDETTSTFSPVLSANNKHAIYRTSSGVGALTIVSTGGDAINSTWTYDNGIINTISSPVNILSSVIENYLSSGPLTINAGNTTVSSAISSASSNALVFNANSTLTNTTPTTTVNAAITNAGSITINTGAFNIADNISTTSTAAITISAANGFSTSTSTRRTISTQGGNITINADFDANGSGWLDIDDLTLNPGAANSIVRCETFNFNTTQSRKPYINGTGSFTFESNDATFGEAIVSNWFVMDQDANGISGLTLGKSGSTANVNLNSAFTVTGPIIVYGGFVEVNNTITSSGNSDVLLKGITNTNASVHITSGGITKIGGTGTLTMQGNGRTYNAGTISATGTGVLNVIMWSDFDGDNVGGGASNVGPISTNGGHLWMGGSNSNGGSYTWNGLAVGDGPSVGAAGANPNALEMFGHVTTNGGDLLLWAGNGNGGVNNGIVTNAGWELNVGNGDVVFITPSVLGTGPSLLLRQNGGTFTLVPNGTSFPNTLNWRPEDSVYNGMINWNFPDEFNYLWIENPATLTNLSIGRYDGMTSGGVPVVFSNTSNINFNLPTTIAGSMSFYGGVLALSSNLTTTNTTTGNILLSGTTISGTGNIAPAAGRTATINVSSASTYDGIVSGSGSGFTKLGAGMLTLTKDHTYSGPTVISAGDLQVGTGGSVSQTSSGTVSNTSGVTVANNSKLILTPNENILFAAPISGAGGVEIKGASGAYYNAFLTGTAATIATNSSVLEVLTRITGGLMDGQQVANGATQVTGAYVKSYDAASNTASLQFQQYDGMYTKCVFSVLSQSGSNVQIRANTSIYNGAAYRTGNHLGANMATGSIQMGLATSSSTAGYGMSRVYLSGKVNFTGALSYSGNTTLSNTVTSVTSPNTYSYISKGTQEITDASSSFPDASNVINNGLVIFNRATPLTIASNMEGTEEVLQVGAAITLTGANTHSGNTTIDLNKSLNIGSGGTTGSITGNIINYGTLTFNRSDSSSYAGIISGSGALVKSGSNLFTLTGLNTYTGSTTINDGSLILERDVPATSSSGFSGLGTLVIQPSSNSFTSAVSYPIAGFTVSSSIGGLTIGKPTNTAAITFANATTIAGPITAYGGTITANANLVSTRASNAPILLQGSKVIHNQGVSVQTNGSDITYDVTNSPWTTAADQGISLGTVNGTTATINAQGGNVSIASSFASTGVTNTGGNPDVAILMRNSLIKTSASGTVTLNGNAYDNASTTGDFIWGTMLHSNEVIQTEHGAISITGTGGKTNGNARGIIADNTALKVISVSGPITFTEVMPNGHSVANHTGTYFKPAATNAIKIGADGTLVTSSTSNVVFDVARITFDGTITPTVVNTNGTVTIQPVGNQFDNAVSLAGLSLSNTATGFTIGKSTNTANITFANAITIAGPIAAYGGSITLDANLTTTNNGAISLHTDNPLDGLSTARTLTAAGAFKYIPRETTFTADVTYPIANLTATSTGLTIGKLTNDKNITINQDVTGGAGIELYGATININSNLKTTSGGAMYLDGNTTIAAGKYIESDGDFTHDGNMTFKSSATGTAAFGKLGGTFISLSGTATVERYIPARRAFRLLSPSVTTSTTIRENWQENGRTDVGLGTHITGNGGLTNGFDVTASNNPSLFTHNQTTGAWQAITNTNSNTLTAGTAYRLMVRGDRTTDMSTNTPALSPTVLRATGALFTGNYDPIINQLSEGYSFIGNPYQAPIDIKAALDASSNMNTDVVYYWDPTLNDRGGYVTRELTTNDNTPDNSSFNQYLQPWQAVFVKKSNTSSEASMPLTENHKTVVNASAGIFRNASTIETGKIRVNLLASVNNQWKPTDGALALFNSSYSWNTTSEDHNKFANLDEEVSFLMNEKSIAIAKLNNPNATDEIPIKLNNLRHTNYQWQFELANYNGATPYLLDTQTNTYVTIENNTTVPFIANGSQNRFKIVFQNEALSTPEFSNQMVLYPNPGKSDSGFNLMGITNAKVSLYNLIGQKLPVETSVVGSNTHVKPSIALSHGVYLVNITQDGKTAQVKWIVE